MRGAALARRVDETTAGPARNRAAASGAWSLVGAMTVAAAVGFSLLSVARHAAFQSHAFDLGNMDQAAWNTIHGHLLRFTDMDVGPRVLTSRLAIHVEPLLVVLSLFYLIHSGPETLLVLQALVVTSGAVPCYLIARSLLRSDVAAVVFPAAYLLHPTIQNALLDDFHPVTMSATLLLWAVYFLLRDALRAFAVFAVLAAATKEEVALLVAALGIWLLLRGRRSAGLTVIGAGIAWFLICVLLIIPSANPAGHSPYLARYAYLGHGVGGILVGVLRHPGTVMRTLTSESRLDYLTYLLHPAGFVSVLGTPALALSLPVLLINMLSADPRMYSGFYQYSAEIIPFVLIAAALGIRECGRAAVQLHAPAARLLPPVLCGVVLIASVVDSRLYGFSPIATGYGIPSPGPHQALEARMIGAIPESAAVAAADETEPHLSDRSWIYLLPTVHPRNGPPADYVVLDASIPALPVRPATLHSLIVRLLRSGYFVTAARDGVLILRRGRGRIRIPSGFYSFAFRAGPYTTPARARWGPLRLAGLTLHPSGDLTRSRPDVGVEAYWRAGVQLPHGARITFLLSPVYDGAHPALSARWQRETDSPTWDWLPLAVWPAHRTIRTASLPLITPFGAHGRVDVAIEVDGLGSVSGVPRSAVLDAGRRVIRVGTYDILG